MDAISTPPPHSIFHHLEYARRNTAKVAELRKTDLRIDWSEVIVAKYGHTRATTNRKSNRFRPLGKLVVGNLNRIAHVDNIGN
jgi:hypothetical protein